MEGLLKLVNKSKRVEKNSESNHVKIKLNNIQTVAEENPFVVVHWGKESEEILNVGEHQAFIGDSLNFSFEVCNKAKKSLGKFSPDILKRILLFGFEDIHKTGTTFPLVFKESQATFKVVLEMNIELSDAARQDLIEKKAKKVTEINKSQVSKWKILMKHICCC